MSLLDGAKQFGWHAINFIGMSRDAEANPWGYAISDLGVSTGVQTAVAPSRDAAWEAITTGLDKGLVAVEENIPGGQRISSGLRKAAEVLEVDYPAGAFYAAATLVSPSKLASGVKVLPKVAGGSKVILDDILKLGSKVVPKIKVGSASLKTGGKGASAADDAIRLLKTNVAEVATKRGTLSKEVKELNAVETQLKSLAKKVDELAPSYRMKTLSGADFLKFRSMEDDIAKLSVKRDGVLKRISTLVDDIPTHLDDSIKIMSKQTAHFDDMVTTMSKMSDEIASYGGKGLETLSSQIPRTALTKAAVLGGGLLGGGYVIGSAMDWVAQKAEILPDWGQQYDEFKEQVDSQIEEMASVIDQILELLGVSADPSFPSEGEDAEALAELLEYLAVMLADTGKINGIDPSAYMGDSLRIEDLAALYEAGLITDEDLARFGINPSEFQSWAKIDQRAWYRYAVYAIALFGAGVALWLIAGNWRDLKDAVEDKVGVIMPFDLPKLPIPSLGTKEKEIYW